MPALTPERKFINGSTLGSVLHEPGWLCRRVGIRNLGGASSKKIQKLVNKVVPHVEDVEIASSAREFPGIFSGLCSPRAARLKKLRVTAFTVGFGFSRRNECTGNMLLCALRDLPALEELELSNLRFSSSEGFEESFASTTTLQKLVMRHLDAVGDDEEVALAFRHGFQRNRSLTSVELEFHGAREGPFLKECIVGLTGHRSVKELSLNTQFITSFSDDTNGEIQALVSGTSLSKIIVTFGDDSALSPFFLGLSTNSSIEEVVLAVTNEGGPREGTDDATVALAIQECFAKNATLRSLHLAPPHRGFGPQSRKALANGVSQLANTTLKEFKAGAHTISPSLILELVPKLYSVSLEWLRSPNWRWLARGMQNVQESPLRVLDLSKNRLKTENLQMILPCLSRLSELTLNNCNITDESIPVLCNYIRNAPLKKLELIWNPFGVRGANQLFLATGASTSLEHLKVAGLGEADDRRTGRAPEVDLNECHEAIRTMLTEGRLVSLSLHSGRSPPLEEDAVRSIATGLRETGTLKTIQLPWFNRALIGILGEGLVENGSLEYLEVTPKSALSHRIESMISVGLSPVEEEAMLAFIGMMPRLKRLSCIENLFDFVPSERIAHALISALKEHMVLKKIVKHSGYAYGHVRKNEIVQFYLELNQLGRLHYESARPENKPIPAGVLPHLFARVSDPEYASHLYYFLRHTSPDLLVGQDSSSRKRSANRDL